MGGLQEIHPLRSSVEDLIETAAGKAAGLQAVPSPPQALRSSDDDDDYSRWDGFDAVITATLLQ
jgi:hypothetical protein